MTQAIPLLTVGQAVERLAGHGIVISDEAVRQWARTGRVRHVKLPGRGGKYLFRPEDIDAIAEPAVPRRAS